MASAWKREYKFKRLFNSIVWRYLYYCWINEILRNLLLKLLFCNHFCELRKRKRNHVVLPDVLITLIFVSQSALRILGLVRHVGKTCWVGLCHRWENDNLWDYKHFSLYIVAHYEEIYTNDIIVSYGMSKSRCLNKKESIVKSNGIHSWFCVILTKSFCEILDRLGILFIVSCYCNIFCLWSMIVYC